MDGRLGIIFRNRYKFLFLTLAIIVGFVGFSIYSSYKNLTITFTNPSANLKVGVYKYPAKANYDSPDQAISKDNLVKEVSQNTKLKLKKGQYVVATSGNDDYQQQVELEDLSKTSQTFIVNPSFSAKKLAGLLTQEQPAILTAINQSVGGLSGKYRVKTGKLYLDGDWYGTIIEPNLTTEQIRTQYVDVFRLVAHKENGTWKVLTLPPALILSQPAYPTIPRQVLVDVNQMPQ